MWIMGWNGATVSSEHLQSGQKRNNGKKRLAKKGRACTRSSKDHKRTRSMLGREQKEERARTNTREGIGTRDSATCSALQAHSIPLLNGIIHSSNPRSLGLLFGSSVPLLCVGANNFCTKYLILLEVSAVLENAC